MTVDAGQMLVFAVIGLVANVVSIVLLASRRDESLNMRGAFLEVLSRRLRVGRRHRRGLVIVTTGFDQADSIASLLIAAMILPRAWSLLREASGSCSRPRRPASTSRWCVEHLAGASGVIDVHDLHAWQITSGMPALSAHVTVTDEALETRGVGEILDELGGCVASHFGIDHATFQVEPESHREHEPGEAHR